MPLTSTPTAYGTVTKTFHWITALLILTAIPLGLIGADMAFDIRGSGGEAGQAEIDRAVLVFSLHKTIGISAFFVALGRIAWALSQPKPGLLNGDHRAEAMVAETVHWVLYAAMLITPLAGWVTHAAETGFAPIWWPFGQTLPFVPQDTAVAGTAGWVHYLASRVLIVAITLHVAGALKHHLFDRDATLRRMLSGRADAAPSSAQPGHTLPVLAAMAIWAGVLGAGLAPVLGGKAGTGATPPAQQAGAGNWQVEEGTLAISITQMGNTVTGEFANWQADITFADDPDRERNGRVEVTIAIPSLTLGSVTDQAMGPDYFAAEDYPEATFTADILRAEGAGNFVAEGELTLKGETMPVTLPFTLTLDAQRAAMSGDTTLDRREYDIGEGVEDEGTLAFNVGVEVSLTATRQ
jgi:cytochrome b561/polyisoprenoid-binding protein YceI